MGQPTSWASDYYYYHYGDLSKIYHKCASGMPRRVNDKLEIMKPGLRQGNACIHLAQALVWLAAPSLRFLTIHLKSLYHSVLWQIHIVLLNLIYHSLHIVFGDLITSGLTVVQSRFRFPLPIICSVYPSTYFSIVIFGRIKDTAGNIVIGNLLFLPYNRLVPRFLQSYSIIHVF